MDEQDLQGDRVVAAARLVVEQWHRKHPAGERFALSGLDGAVFALMAELDALDGGDHWERHEFTTAEELFEWIERREGRDE